MKTVPVEGTEAAPETEAVRLKNRREQIKAFNLTRFFALASLLCIGVLASVSIVILYRVLAHHMLERDAIALQEFIQSIGDTEALEFDLTRAQIRGKPMAITEFFMHIAELPEVIKANIYAPDQTIMWSNDPELIGRRFTDNLHLQQAVAGELVFKLSDKSGLSKEEYKYFSEGITRFAEYYFPVANVDRNRIVAVVEIYKSPENLLRVLKDGIWFIWISALVGGSLLYGLHIWIIRRASVIMQAQQERLVESETMAAVGEMASVVAHSIRNPLASIRSSAELALEDQTKETFTEAARDIVSEADRLEGWVRRLILISQHEREGFKVVGMGELLGDCVKEFAPTMRRLGVTLALDVQEPIASILGDPPLLEQVCNNLIANSLDAMPNGGALTVTVCMDMKRVHVVTTFADTGQGIPEDRLSQVFKPFFTSKRAGLGLGLSLVKRIVERHGGTIELSSVVNQGTTVSLRFPAEPE
ncbi:MAG: ATP-binding protein [Alphaproteobacteria bacterium]|nr:ATP-binding protein [Alphaproteobacteria bacterium]